MIAAPTYLSSDERQSWDELAPLVDPSPEYFAAFESLVCNHALVRCLGAQVQAHPDVEDLRRAVGQAQVRLARGLFKFRLPLGVHASIVEGL